ncbi:MAG: flagellar export protein FliJ [Thermodesulfobacteriota bacterium]|nr:flagellar export protein FliJ [Thermodesulfobacteriota bacterium]
MRFSFRLQSLLNWKESLEEESRMKLARKNRQLRRQEEEIQELAGQREENDRGLRKRMGKGLLAREYLIHKEFNEESYQDLVQKELNKKQTEQEVKEERERLTGLMKERKILERLKEKRFKTFLNELGKLEQKDLDEVAIGAYCKGIRFAGNSEGDS